MNGRQTIAVLDVTYFYNNIQYDHIVITSSLFVMVAEPFSSDL